MTEIAVIGAAAISPAGLDWRGLAQAPARSDATLAVPTLPPRPGAARMQKMVARSAELGWLACTAALADAGLQGRSDMGYWLGVGASGGDFAQMEAMLAASMADGQFDIVQFAERGLFELHPLHAFQLMHNFTLCHGAIGEGLGGPNAALFSRGAGTVTALAEAVWALRAGTCTHALAGGADSALHPITLAELGRERDRGIAPAEGAAVLVLTADAEAPAEPARPPPLAFVRACHVIADPDLAAAAIAPLRAWPPDLAVIAPCGPDARRALLLAVGAMPVYDVSRSLGDALGAGPALAWCTALDALRRRGGGRALVLSAGLDGDLGVVALELPA